MSRNSAQVRSMLVTAITWLCLVAAVRLVRGQPLPPQPLPPPVPPQYDTLKDLHVAVSLVAGGQPDVAIVVPVSGLYGDAAATIQGAIEQRTGVKVPIVSDDHPQAAVPIPRNLIVLGNRSTNRTINALYDLHYCLVDLKYPGPEGYVIRSVHNPFGNGKGVIIVGGSDPLGVAEGATALANTLSQSSSAERDLSIGWTMLTKLGKGVSPQADIEEFETWEASQGYGSIGYFGWCSISKRMAMYYMTGDPLHAREVVRLSFPDQQAIADIERIDGERIENKHDPLAGFYHYNAHMAILYWDLIEESPAFTDEERLRITNAFARQLNHRRDEGVYGLTQPPRNVGSRHGQWAAIALYCLGRYFNKDYPHPVWAQCERAGQLAFQSLHTNAWVDGESDNLFWYNTGIAPVLTYMVLTGDRKPLENGVLGILLRGQEILISGRVPDWALNSASLDLFHKAAYLTGDGRWIAYRERSGVDTNVFRLGQSFWPDEHLQPQPPEDLVGTWWINHVAPPAWEARGSGLPRETSFYFASYRSATDATGDFVLLDGLNGASRNPYHTFDILELRLNGRTVLEGYHNQVLSSADGLVEPAVAMDAALLYCDVVGSTASAVGQVPQAAFCSWQRTLCMRTGRYAIIADDLAFRTDSQNMTLDTTWTCPRGQWDPQEQAIRMAADRSENPVDFELRPCDVQEVSGGDVVTMIWNGAAKKDEHHIAFSLIGQTPSQSASTLACLRLADNAAAMTLPQPALGVVGQYGQVQGEFVVLAEDHLYGHALRAAGIEDVLVSSDVPIDIDWDFSRGVIEVFASQPANVRLSLASAKERQRNGLPAAAEQSGDMHVVSLPKGRHTFTSAVLVPEARRRLAAALERLLAEGRQRRAEELAAAGPHVWPAVAELPVALSARIGGSVTDFTTAASADGPQLCAAEGNTMHVLALDGREVRTMQTDHKIRVLHWWDEHQLLLAGCVDEKVVAFDGDGQRMWTFTSEMDPAVYEAAKTYWFKSAPGHEGIHGVYTGTFDEGKSRCFVGSACTLEILDEHGALVKRSPVFWGPPRKFLLTPGPENSTNLLISQWPNGVDNLAIVNSRTLAVTGNGYYSVPAGHTFVSGWTAQNRTALVHEDLDGDGQREVVTAINGTWNRVTVYSEQGQPLANAQFGPGASADPRTGMRDMDIADLNGDGKKELVVGTAEGLIVVLDHQCGKVWSQHLPSPPVSLRCMTSPAAANPWIMVGCDDGTVAALDAAGPVLALGKVPGRPTHLQAVHTPAGLLAVFATDQGTITGFTLGDR